MPEVTEETTWPVSAYARWMLAPIALRDDQPAFDAVLRDEEARLREEALTAGHIILPGPATAKVRPVYVDEDGVTWEGGTVGPANGLHVLTELRVLRNPDPDVPHTPRHAAASGEKVWIIATLCTITIVLYGIGLILGVQDDLTGASVCVATAIAALGAAYALDARKAPPATGDRYRARIVAAVAVLCAGSVALIVAGLTVLTRFTPGVFLIAAGCAAGVAAHTLHTREMRNLR